MDDDTENKIVLCLVMAVSLGVCAVVYAGGQFVEDMWIEEAQRQKETRKQFCERYLNRDY